MELPGGPSRSAWGDLYLAGTRFIKHRRLHRNTPALDGINKNPTTTTTTTKSLKDNNIILFIIKKFDTEFLKKNKTI